MSIVAPERGSFPATHPVAAMAMPLATRRSGILTLRHGKVRHDIAYVEGRATGVDSNAVKESMPVLLVAKGQLTQEQSNEALEALRQRGATIDRVLVERGWITAEEMEELLRWRAAILVVKTAAWTEGKYSFRAMAHPRLSGPELPLKMPQLLLQGLLRSKPGPGVFLPVRQALDKQVRWSAAAVRDDYVLEDGDRALIVAVDGARSLGDALTASRLPTDRAQALSWLLLVSGAIEATAGAATEAAETAPAAEPEEASLELELDDSSPAEAIATPVDSGAGQAIATPVDSGPQQPAAPAPEPPPPVDEATGKARLAKLEASLFGANAKPIAPKARPASWGSAEGAAIPLGGQAATPEATDDAGDERAQMRKALKQMRRQDHFEILGVAQDADESTIRKAYFLLAKRYHPDRFTGQSTELNHLAESIFALIGEANEVLSSPKRREEYVYQQAHADEEEQDEAEALAKVGQILDAERSFKTGLQVLTVGQIPAAHEHFRRAYEGYAEDPEYQCYYGYTTYRMKMKADPLGARGGIEMIKVVLEANPGHGVALHLLGKIEMLKGDFQGAMSLLRKARRARPADDDIKRDYRRAEHESLKPKKGEGLSAMLGGLFGKKK